MAAMLSRMVYYLLIQELHRSGKRLFKKLPLLLTGSSVKGNLEKEGPSSYYFVWVFKFLCKPQVEREKDLLCQ